MKRKSQTVSIGRQHDPLHGKSNVIIHKKLLELSVNVACCRNKINMQKSTVFLSASNNQNLTLKQGFSFPISISFPTGILLTVVKF